MFNLPRGILNSTYLYEITHYENGAFFWMN